MTKIMPLDDPANYKVAHARIKWLWRNGSVVIGAHAHERMTQRKIDMNDVQQVILYGRIIGHSRPRDYWRYTLRGATPDRKSLTCVVEINGNLMIVTVLPKNRRV